MKIKRRIKDIWSAKKLDRAVCVLFKLEKKGGTFLGNHIVGKSIFFSPPILKRAPIHSSLIQGILDRRDLGCRRQGCALAWKEIESRRQQIRMRVLHMVLHYKKNYKVEYDWLMKCTYESREIRKGLLLIHSCSCTVVHSQGQSTDTVYESSY